MTNFDGDSSYVMASKPLMFHANTLSQLFWFIGNWYTTYVLQCNPGYGISVSTQTPRNDQVLTSFP